MKRIIFLIIATVLVIGLVLPGCGNGNGAAEVIYTFTDAKIDIAIAGPMDYVQGEDMWAGAQLALTETPSVLIGGVSHTLNLIQVETKEIDQPWPGYSAQQIENAITVQGADFVIGGFRTEATIGMIEKAMDNKKIMVICGSATGAMMEQVNDNYAKYKYLFRGTPINELWLLNNNVAILQMVGGGVMTALNTSDTTDVKVSIVSEDLKWTEKPLAIMNMALAGINFTLDGTELVGDTDDDISEQLGRIEADGSHIIFTILSGPVGVTYGKQMGDLAIPALTVGINVEAQDPGFWDATEYAAGEFGAEGMITLGTYAPNVAQSGNLTSDFLDEFAGLPVYTASSYDIINTVVTAIKAKATYDADAGVASVKADDLIAWYEDPLNAQTITGGKAGYYKDEAPYNTWIKASPLPVPVYAHDLKYGPDWVTGLGVQWQEGDPDEGVQIGVWPKAEFGAYANALFLWGDTIRNALGIDWAGFEHPGTEMFEIPMWMVVEWLTP